MPHATPDAPRPGVLRQLLGVVALVGLVGVAVWTANGYLKSSVVPRPPDFLQVWAAGRLALTGGNPYDGEQMFTLQAANRIPSGFASMMWVPPWGLALAMPIGALPIDAAQALWVYGQLALIVVIAVWLWTALKTPSPGPQSRADLSPQSGGEVGLSGSSSAARAAASFTSPPGFGGERSASLRAG